MRVHGCRDGGKRERERERERERVSGDGVCVHPSISRADETASAAQQLTHSLPPSATRVRMREGIRAIDAGYESGRQRQREAREREKEREFGKFHSPSLEDWVT